MIGRRGKRGLEFEIKMQKGKVDKRKIEIFELSFGGVAVGWRAFEFEIIFLLLILS